MRLMLRYKAACFVGALPTAARNAQLFSEFLQALSTVFHRPADLFVGDAIANTNVHRLIEIQMRMIVNCGNYVKAGSG